MQCWHSKISPWIFVLRHQNDDKATGNHYAIWNLGLQKISRTHTLTSWFPLEFFPFLSFFSVTTVDWHGRLCRGTPHILHILPPPLPLLLLPQSNTGFFWCVDEVFHGPSPPPHTQICLLMYQGPSFHMGIWSLDFGLWALYRNLLYQGVLLSWYVGIERNGHVLNWLRSWWWPEVKPLEWREW